MKSQNQIPLETPKKPTFLLRRTDKKKTQKLEAENFEQKIQEINENINEDDAETEKQKADQEQQDGKWLSLRTLFLIFLQLISLYEMCSIGMCLHLLIMSGQPLQFSIMISLMIVQRLFKVFYMLIQKKFIGAIVTTFFLDYIQIYFELKQMKLTHLKIEKKDQNFRFARRVEEEIQNHKIQMYTAQLHKEHNENLILKKKKAFQSAGKGNLKDVDVSNKLSPVSAFPFHSNFGSKQTLPALTRVPKEKALTTFIKTNIDLITNADTNSLNTTRLNTETPMKQESLINIDDLEKNTPKDQAKINPYERNVLTLTENNPQGQNTQNNENPNSDDSNKLQIRRLGLIRARGMNVQANNEIKDDQKKDQDQNKDKDQDKDQDQAQDQDKDQERKLKIRRQGALVEQKEVNDEVKIENEIKEIKLPIKRKGALKITRILQLKDLNLDQDDQANKNLPILSDDIYLNENQGQQKDGQITQSKMKMKWMTGINKIIEAKIPILKNQEWKKNKQVEIMNFADQIKSKIEKITKKKNHYDNQMVTLSQFKSFYSDIIKAKILTEFIEQDANQEQEDYFLSRKWKMISSRIQDGFTLTVPCLFIMGWVLTNRLKDINDENLLLFHLSMWYLGGCVALTTSLISNLQMQPFRQHANYILYQLVGIFKNFMISGCNVLSAVILWGFASRVPLYLLAFEGFIALILMILCFSKIKEVHIQQVREELGFCLIVLLISLVFGIVLSYLLIFGVVLIPLDSFLMKHIIQQVKKLSKSTTLNLDGLMQVQFKSDFLFSILKISHLFFPIHSIALFILDAAFNNAFFEQWYSSTMFYRRIAALFFILSTAGIIYLIKEYSDFYKQVSDIILDVIRKLQEQAHELQKNLIQKEKELQEGQKLLNNLLKEVETLNSNLSNSEANIKECEAIEEKSNRALHSFGGNLKILKPHIELLKSTNIFKASQKLIKITSTQRLEVINPIFMRQQTKVNDLLAKVSDLKEELKKMERVNGVKL